MKVEMLMKTQVQTCSPDTNLETVAMLMWNYNCGAIPIIDDAGIPTGIITDRDIAIGSAFDHKPLWEIPTQQVTNNRKLLTCKVDDDVRAALLIMQEGQIHRLPVVDADGLLKGILSMDNIILAAKTRATKSNTVSFGHVMTALKDIYSPVQYAHRIVATDTPVG